MPYTQTTIAALTIDLAAALGDPDNRFWSTTELDLLLREALSTWAVMAAYWRETRIFSTDSTKYIYDLVDEGILDAAPDPTQILNHLQYSLMEPPFAFTDPSQYTTFPTTEMFSPAEIYSALTRAIAQFNFDSGVRLIREADLDLPLVGDYQLDLPATVVDIRRVVIRQNSGTRFRIDRQDEYESQYRGSPEDLFNLGSPFSYSFVLARQPGIRLVYPVSFSGKVEVVTVRAASLPPRDLQWVVKWLTLHFLLSQDGQARDHARAQYCWKRYRDGINLAKMLPSYMIGYINGRPSPISPVSDEDRWNPTWMNTAPSTPTSIFSLGWNMIALSPRPGATAASIRLDGIVQSQVPPIGDITPIQIGEEHLAAILGYAQHIALFKLGGKEFQDSAHFYERFFDAAVEYNDKLAAESKNFWLMRDRAARDKEYRYVRRESGNSVPNTQEG